MNEPKQRCSNYNDCSFVKGKGHCPIDTKEWENPCEYDTRTHSTAQLLKLKRHCGDGSCLITIEPYVQKRLKIAKREGAREVLDELRKHLRKRANSFEVNYPIGNDQRDGAKTRISEIEQTLMTLDAIESLRDEQPAMTEQQHCGHECNGEVCATYDGYCDEDTSIPCPEQNCPHDTRTNSSAPEQQRIDAVIKELETRQKRASPQTDWVYREAIALLQEERK